MTSTAFKISISPFKEGASYILEDIDGGAAVEVFPFCGGILNQFKVRLDEKEYNVIEGYNSPEEAVGKVSEMFRGVKLFPYAGRIRKALYEYKGRTYKLSRFISKGHALHGLVYESNFSVTNSISDHEKAVLCIEFLYQGEETGYPFPFSIKVEYHLLAGNFLSLKTFFTNQGQEPMPFADGWHPYFTLGVPIDDCLLQMKTKNLIEFDEELIPTGKEIPFSDFYEFAPIGKEVFDNCFTLDLDQKGVPIIMIHPRKEIQIELLPDPEYNFLQVYTAPDRKSIALENQTSAPDSYSNHIGLQTLLPGESRSFSTAIRVSKPE